MDSREFLVSRSWDGNWTVRVDGPAVIYSTPGKAAAEAFAQARAREERGPSRVRILRADCSLERTWVCDPERELTAAG